MNEDVHDSSTFSVLLSSLCTTSCSVLTMKSILSNFRISGLFCFLWRLCFSVYFGFGCRYPGRILWSLGRHDAQREAHATHTIRYDTFDSPGRPLSAVGTSFPSFLSYTKE